MRAISRIFPFMCLNQKCAKAQQIRGICKCYEKLGMIKPQTEFFQILGTLVDMSHELWLRQFYKNVCVMQLLGLNILFLFQLHQTKCVQDDGVSNLKHGCIRNSFMHEAAVLKFFSFFPTDYYLCFCLFDAGGWKLRLINTKVAI